MANQTYFCTLTAIGEAKDANAKALGTALKLTEMAVGDGNGALPTPDRTRTTLVRQVRRAPLNTLKPDPQNPGQLIAEQIIPEDVGGWWIRELGIYDDAGDLIAIGNCPETYKPQLAEGSGRVQVVRMVLIMSSAATVQLKIDPSVVLATRKYADDQDAAVEARMNAAVAALGGSTQTALGGKADLAGATFTGLLYASKGFRIGGAVPIQANAAPGSFSMENTTLRNYIGDGTGWTWAFSKRANNVTTDLLTVSDTGYVGIGTSTPPAAPLDIGGNAAGAVQAILTRGASDGGFQLRARNGSGTSADTEQARFGMEYGTQGLAAGFTFIRGASALNSALAFVTNETLRARFDSAGNFIVGLDSAPHHKIARNVPTDAGNPILEVQAPVNAGLSVFSTSGPYGSTTRSTSWLGKDINTNRSMNAAGTINANGADYAEYMTKAEDCGTIAKGDIVGVDSNGQLTDKWARAVSFLIKSTDPSYVGGDVWGSEAALGKSRPVEPSVQLPTYEGPADPGAAPAAPIAPKAPKAGADADTLAVYQQAQREYKAAMLAYQPLATQYAVDLAAYQQAQETYQAACAAVQHHFDAEIYPAYLVEREEFDALVEQARQRVDRMAYCGQVPVNVKGAKPGQYVVPVQVGTGIAGQLVDGDAITFDQYRRAVGIVQNVLEDGRANVRVKPV